MAAWLEHASSQLQEVEQVFFCSVGLDQDLKQEPYERVIVSYVYETRGIQWICLVLALC